MRDQTPKHPPISGWDLRGVEITDTKGAPRITDVASSEAADSIGVDRFSATMRRKLDLKRSQGKHGWNHTPATGWGCTIRELETMLRQHLAKGDVVDVANFCMMIWNRRNPHG